MIFVNKYYIFVLLISLLVIDVSAQTKFLINGHLKDAHGAAIPNASVSLRNTANDKQTATQTDSNGAFEFRELVKGNYQIVAEAEGFSSASKSVFLDGQNVSDVEIVLSIGNISEKVTVSATRTQVAAEDTAVPVSVIDREEFEEKNVNTTGDILRKLPGVSVVGEGSFRVRPQIRGLASNRVLVLVDGERLNNARTSTDQSGIELGLVGTEQVETIEVVRGAGSVLYGTDALGGIVNIITRDTPRPTEGGFRFGAIFNGFYSSDDNGRRGSIALNGSNKFFAFRVAQSLERFENYLAGNLKNIVADGVNADGEVLNSQSHGSNTQVTTRFFFNENNDLRLNYTRRRAANIGVPTLAGAFNAFFPYSDLDKFNSHYELTSVNNHLAKFSAGFYYQNQKRNFSNILTVPAVPPFFPGLNNFSETISDTKSVGFEVVTNWTLGKRHLVTAGFDYFRDKNVDARREISRIPVFVENRTLSLPRATFGSVAGFVQDEFEVNKRFKLIGGLRVERSDVSSKPTTHFGLPATLTPSQIQDLGLEGFNGGVSVNGTSVAGDFGAVFKITDEVSLTGRVGRSFREPNLFERFFTGAGSITGLVVANPELEAETGVNFDASLKFRRSKYAGSFTYFNNTYKNFLSTELAHDRNGNLICVSSCSTSRPVNVYQTVNRGRIRLQGFEGEFEMPFKFGLGFLTPSGNISYLRGDNLETNEPFEATPLKTVLNLRWTNLRSNYYADWTTRIVNKQDRLSAAFLLENGGAEPGFAVTDIGGGYKFERERYRMSFNIGIRNLFDRFFYEQFELAPSRGRSFVFGTTWEIK